jgi:DNA-binding CsgD family transcriptional regulator
MNAVRSSRHPHLPLVGREPEMRVLSTCLEDLSSGSGHLVLLAGEPGIGKTRLAEEAARYGSTLGVKAVWGQCFEWAGTPAYWPWIEILRDLIGSHEPGDVHKHLGSNSLLVAQLVPEASGTPPDPPVASLMNPEQMRFRLFDELTQFLKKSAREQPLLLILEDLHWADPASLLMLSFVSHELDDSAICIIGTYRDAEVRRDQPLARALASLIRAHSTQRLILGGLERVHIEDMVREISGTNPPDGVAEHVFLESEGNPFYATELVSLLVSRGEITNPPQSGSWKTTVPSGVREVIGNSLDRLSRQCNEMLHVAAVIGREFDLRILDRTCDLETDDVRAALSEAIAARVLTEHGGVGRFRFSHVLIQETIYEEMSSSLRFDLHGKIGDIIERVYASNLRPHFGDLARHFRLAPVGDNLRKAVNYLVLAGDQAMEQVAWESAVGHYELAVELYEIREDHLQDTLCLLLLKLGDAQFRAAMSRGQEYGVGSDPEARETFRRAAELAKESGLPEYFAAAALGLAGPSLHHTTNDVYRLQVMREALEVLPGEDSVLKIWLLARLGRDFHHWSMCDPAKLPKGSIDLTTLDTVARQYSDSAIEMARRLGDQSALVYALLARPQLISEPIEFWIRQELKLANETVQRSREIADTTFEAWSIYERTGLLLWSGDADGARRGVDQMANIAANLKMPVLNWHVLVRRACDAICTGRFKEARRLIEDGNRLWPNSMSLNYLEIVLCLEESRPLGNAGERFLDNVNREEPDWMSFVPIIFLHELEQGRAGFVRKMIQQSNWWEVLRTRPRTPSIVQVMAVFTDLVVMLELSEWWEPLYNDLLPYGGLSIGPGFGIETGGSVSYYLGILASALGRRDEAEHHFAFSLERNAQCGYQTYVAYTKFAWASVLLKQGEQRNRERGSAYLEDARVIAREIGMVRLQRIIAEIEQTSGIRRRNNDSAGLSPRELDVLKLLVEGKSDREIGEELFISHYTVMRHVSHILRKLNVESRGAAAVQGVRRGLV